MTFIVNLVFVLLVIAACYFVFGVPLYNYRNLPTRVPKDAFIIVFAFVFLVVILLILWSVRNDFVPH